jgi:hypothetical protein
MTPRYVCGLMNQSTKPRCPRLRLMQMPAMNEVARALDAALDRPTIKVLKQVKGMMSHGDDDVGIAPDR